MTAPIDTAANELQKRFDASTGYIEFATQSVCEVCVSFHTTSYGGAISAAGLAAVAKKKTLTGEKPSLTFLRDTIRGLIETYNHPYFVAHIHATITHIQPTTRETLNTEVSTATHCIRLSSTD